MDVANVRDDLTARRVLLVSTFKTFKYKWDTSAMPRVREGTHWLVLDMPTVNVVSGRRTGAQTSPVRLVYAPKKRESQCFVAYTKGAKTNIKHRWCELDDHVIAHIGARYGLKILSNDRRLADGQTATHLTEPHADLLKHTKIKTLVYRRGAWRRVLA